MSFVRWDRSVQWWAPSYSTATRHRRQPMSRRARNSPPLSRTTIWVLGAGRPLWTISNLVSDSGGDSAPGSTSGITLRTPALTPVFGGERDNGVRVEFRCPAQGVEYRNRTARGEPTREVERRSFRSRHRKTIDDALFVLGYPNLASADPLRRPAIGRHRDLGRKLRPDPLASGHRGSRKPDKHTGPFGPMRRRLGSPHRIEPIPPPNIDVVRHPIEVVPQFPPRHHPRSNRPRPDKSPLEHPHNQP